MKTVSFVSAEPIDKGWSGDKKYRVQTADGRTLLLRLSPVEQLARKREECTRMRQAAALGVPLCCPVEVGTCPEGTYSLYEWIDGEEAEAAVPRLAPADAYRYGVQAGRYLKQLHTLPAPVGQEPWDIRYARKFDHKLALYAARSNTTAGRFSLRTSSTTAASFRGGRSASSTGTTISATWFFRAAG